MNEKLDLSATSDISTMNVTDEYENDKKTAAVSSQNVEKLGSVVMNSQENQLVNPVVTPSVPTSEQVPGVSNDMLNAVNAFMNNGQPAAPAAEQAPAAQAVGPAPATPVAETSPVMGATPAMPEATLTPITEAAPVEATPAAQAVEPTPVTPAVPEAPVMPDVLPIDMPGVPEPTPVAETPVTTPVAETPVATPVESATQNNIPDFATPMGAPVAQAVEPAAPTMPVFDNNPVPSLENQAPAVSDDKNVNASLDDEIEVLRDMISRLHDNLDELDDRFNLLQEKISGKKEVLVDDMNMAAPASDISPLAPTGMSL